MEKAVMKKVQQKAVEKLKKTPYDEVTFWDFTMGFILTPTRSGHFNDLKLDDYTTAA